MGQDALPFTTRFWFAWVGFFRILLDARFAARAWAIRDALPEPAVGSVPSAPTPPTKAAESSGELDEERVRARIAEAVEARERALDSAHQDALRGARDEGATLFLSLLQQDGRLVDFLRQDVTSFNDADVGIAARVVHEGCRNALDAHVELEPVRKDAEGGRVVVTADEARQAVKLIGNLKGDAPFTGTLRHKGWRATNVSLPVPTAGHDATLICPAEVEL